MSALNSETAAMLADSVAAYVTRGGAADHVATLHAQGWLQTALPEEAGGLGFGVDAAALVAGGLARGHLAEPVAATYLAARMLALAAPESEAALALGEGRLVALAHDSAAPVLCDAEGRLSGALRHVAGAQDAATLLVIAERQGGPVLAELSAEAEGMTLTHAARVDGGALSALRLDAAPGTVLAQGPEVRAALRQSLAETRLVTASELLAHVEEMLALTLEHLRTRRQFGQSLGAFQALQHKAVDLYLPALLSKAVLDRALAQAAEGLAPDDLDRVACRARARLNDSALALARGSIQMFGALGTTEECLLSPHIKRVLALSGWLGTSAELRRAYAALERDPNHDRKEALTA